MQFSGTDTLCGLYRFNILLSAQKNDIDPNTVINKSATLLLYRNDEYCPYSGIVSEFRCIGNNTDFTIYRATIVPRLWLLTCTIQTRIFQKQKITGIIKSVLNDAGLGGYAKWHIDDNNYPEREYVVQYQESDFNFISRLMEHAGLWYFFDEQSIMPNNCSSTSKESLVVADNAASFAFVHTPSDMLYKSSSGMTEQITTGDRESIHDFAMISHIVPKEVILKDYNYRSPEIDLQSRKPVKDGTIGRIYRYGGHFKNTNEADRQAQIAADSISSTRHTNEGSGNCRSFRAGKRFTLQNHFCAAQNGVQVITRITHNGKHSLDSCDSATYSYANSFSCIPAVAAAQYRPKIKTPVPRIYGITTAQIEARGAATPALDDMGRYKVRMPFDLSHTNNAEASRYIRCAQPYCGSHYGMHFPSHEGTEMVLACVDGDPDRPIGLATVPNSATLPPVVAANKEQNIIRTAGGNELLFDDTDAKQKVRLSTKAKLALEMDDAKKSMSLQSANKNGLLIDDTNEKVSVSAKSHSITLIYKSGSESIVVQTGGGHIISIDDKNKKVTVQTAGGNILEMDDDGQKICLADAANKNQVTLDGKGGKLLLDSQGEISISAAKDLAIKAANISLSSQGKITQAATGNYTLTAAKIAAKADTDVSISGLNVKLEAQVNMSVKGGMQTKVSGAIAELAGDTMTKVKGAVVMIN